MFGQFRTLIAASSFAMLSMGGSALADTLQTPDGEVLLTVTGTIGAANDGESALFDMAMLKDLPVTKFETTTIWTEGVREFSGVSLIDFLEAVDAEGETIRAVALNDYAVDIPVSDAREGGPIIAYEIDGSPMSVREKGPLWIVYPYDANAEYRTETIYSRSIWQLDRLQFE